MKRFYFMLTLPVILIVVLAAACDTPVITPIGTFTLAVSADSGVLNQDGVFDFGIFQGESGSSTVTVTVSNTGETVLSVISASLSDEVNFSLDLPELPEIVAPGESALYSLTFAPTGSGEKPAEITVTVQDRADPAVLRVTGTGNYAPVPRFGITVSDAGTSGANGFYLRDGFKTGNSTKRPNYVKPGTTMYYSYMYDGGDGDIWCIADTPTAVYPSSPAVYEAWDYYILIPPSSPDSWTVTGSGTSPLPSVTWQDISGLSDNIGVTLTANYLYFDEEGDLEAADSVTYQWYRSDAENGIYTAITGATAKTYATTMADNNKYIKVGITLTARTGITQGGEGLSNPTVQMAIVA